MMRVNVHAERHALKSNSNSKTSEPTLERSRRNYLKTVTDQRRMPLGARQESFCALERCENKRMSTISGTAGQGPTSDIRPLSANLMDSTMRQALMKTRRPSHLPQQMQQQLMPEEEDMDLDLKADVGQFNLIGDVLFQKMMKLSEKKKVRQRKSLHRNGTNQEMVQEELYVPIYAEEGCQAGRPDLQLDPYQLDETPKLDHVDMQRQMDLLEDELYVMVTEHETEVKFVQDQIDRAQALGKEIDALWSDLEEKQSMKMARTIKEADFNIGAVSALPAQMNGIIKRIYTLRIEAASTQSRAAADQVWTDAKHLNANVDKLMDVMHERKRVLIQIEEDAEERLIQKYLAERDNAWRQEIEQRWSSQKQERKSTLISLPTGCMETQEKRSRSPDASSVRPNSNFLKSPEANQSTVRLSVGSDHKDVSERSSNKHRHLSRREAAYDRSLQEPGQFVADSISSSYDRSDLRENW